jgi:uncharacterized protein YjbJ (UPF0337 family)
MDENRIGGTMRNVGGKVQEGVGKLAGDPETEAKGKLNQAVGSVQDLYGQAMDGATDAAVALREGAVKTKDVVRDFIEQRPYTMVALALAAGWFVARMGPRMNRRGSWHI